MGAVLVHIDLDGEHPNPSSLAALAAGRAIASSWGATLYAALIVHDALAEQAAPDSTAQVLTTQRVPGVDNIQSLLARAGADKVVVAITDVEVTPLWAAIGVPWQGILDHLRPRLVLFGADAPSAPELGARTGARIGARLLQHARATAGDHVELRDRDGGYVRASDGGAAVALIGAGPSALVGDDDIDLVVLAIGGAGDSRIELASTAPAELAHTLGTVVAIGDDLTDAASIASVKRLAQLLGAHVVGGAKAAAAGAVAAGAVIERTTPLAPELCVAVGSIALDLAGATSLVRVGPSSGKNVEGVLSGPPGTSVAALVRALEELS